MPFRDHFQKLLDKANDTFDQRKGTPPPVPYASKPTGVPQQAAPQQSSSQSSTTYWSWDFRPETPIWKFFNQEKGQTGWGNNEAQNYTDSPNNCFFTPNGQLVLRAIVNQSAPTQEQKFTSARLVSDRSLDSPSGCVVTRLTIPSAKGIWPAFWLLPREPCNWPVDGEVDIAESWNATKVNHTCLHWGQYNGEDWNKHRVVETPIPRLEDPRGTEYAFAWQQAPSGKGGKMVWYIGGKAVMKATIPDQIRTMTDWRIIINVAMGGNVCEGVIPANGTYDFVVHEMKLLTEPAGGWQAFEKDWSKAKEGHAM